MGRPFLDLGTRQTPSRGTSQKARLPALVAFVFFLLLTPSLALGQSSLEKAENFFNEGKYDESLALFDAALKNAFITPKDKAYALCRKGLIISLRNGFNEAEDILRESLEIGTLSKEHESTCSYALLQLYVLRKKDTEALELIKNLGQPSFAPIYRARVWALGAEVARRAGDSSQEVIFLERLIRIMESRKIPSVALKILGKRSVSLEEVKQRLGRGEETAGQISGSGAVVEDDRYQKLVRYMLKALAGTQRGSWKGAHRRWELLEEKNLTRVVRRVTGFAPDVPQVLKRIDALRNADPKALRVGFLVPAEPRLTALSHRILRSGSAFLASPASNGVTISTHVRSAIADAGAIEKATLDLILQDHVHVVIGPVSGALTLGALQAAEAFGVPIFSLGPVADSPSLRSPFLVRMGILAESQSDSLVEHVLQSELRNAAIMAPNDSYGVEMARAFSRSASRMKLPIEKVTFYDSQSDVFTESVEHALGPQDPASRKEEYRAAVKEAKKAAREAKRKFDPSKIKLPALVRFDTLFLPDSLRRARVLSSTFAFKDAKNIRFLGDKQWAEGDRRRSIADEFLNGSRVPQPLEGRYLNHLLMNLSVRDPQFRLDLERQVFDALILARQGQYLAGGVNGFKMAQALREAAWKVEGTTHISGVNKLGEPKTQFKLMAYDNGALSFDLPEWTLAVEEESVEESAVPEGTTGSLPTGP